MPVTKSPKSCLQRVPCQKSPRLEHLQLPMMVRDVHSTPVYKLLVVQRLEKFNIDQAFAAYERSEKFPGKGPWHQQVC